MGPSFIIDAKNEFYCLGVLRFYFKRLKSGRKSLIEVAEIMANTCRVQICVRVLRIEFQGFMGAFQRFVKVPKVFVDYCQVNVRNCVFRIKIYRFERRCKCLFKISCSICAPRLARASELFGSILRDSRVLIRA